MGHVQDLWHKKPGPDGRKIRSARYGHGKRWQARWIDDAGNEPTKVFRTKEAAEAHVIAMENDVRAGNYIDPKHGRQTFEAYAEQWRKNQIHHRESTADLVSSALRTHVYPVFGSRAIGSVRRKDVQDMVNLAQERLAPSTIEITYGFVASVFKSAVLDRVVNETPCLKINLPEVIQKKVVPLVIPQVSKIHLQVPDRMKAAVIIAAASGLRQGELFGLTVDRLEGSCDNVVLVVDRQRGKKAGTWAPLKTEASDRRVAIGLLASRVLWAHLARYREGKYGHVFSTVRRAEVSRQTAGDVWRAAIDGMGLPERSGWHDLRHHHASLLIAKGLSVAAVADRLGHKNQAETFATYSHLWPPDEFRAVAAVDEALALL